jgi:rhodanese-related sulfurtransferase
VNVDGLLAEERASLRRLDPAEAAAAVARGALLVDIRPAAQRADEGELDGALVIERNVLEWRLDSASPDRIAEASPARPGILFCSEGYASSLAAASLRRLGVDATDVIGGYKAWSACQ